MKDHHYIVRTYSAGLGGKLKTGGTRSAKNFDDLAESLARQYPVAFTSTGRSYFTDKDGLELTVMIGVYPGDTVHGKDKIAAEMKRRDAERETARKKQAAKEAELENLISELGEDQSIEILKAYQKG